MKALARANWVPLAALVVAAVLLLAKATTVAEALALVTAIILPGIRRPKGEP